MLIDSHTSFTTDLALNF